LKKIRSEIIERGDSNPKNGTRVFSMRPNTMMKKTDNPTPKTRVFAVPSLFSFNPLKITIPGINEIKRKLKICLNKDMSNKTQMSVINTIINTPKKNSLF
jgi:hypothetical protein